MLARTLPDDTLVVTSLGNASYLWAQVRDRRENFYVEDAMGLALPLALGLAIARPDRRVVVSEGDGALLMHLGTLVTVGAVAPANLTILVIQNGVHGASGGQPVTNAALDLAALALSAGMRVARNIVSPEVLGRALPIALADGGPTFLALATQPDVDEVARPDPFVPVDIKGRFQHAIGLA